MVNEYIDREKAVQAIKNKESADSFDFNEGLISAMNALDEIPSADVKPVVYCKDCKHSYDSVGGWCCSYGICVDCVVDEDFYCRNGEKKK